MKSHIASPSCEQPSGGFHAETAAVRDCSPSRMGSVGGETAGCQGQALEIPAEEAVEGAIRSDACQAREAGSSLREQGTERSSPQLLNAQSVNLEERFPGSSALQTKEVMLLEEKGVKD